MSQAGNSEPSEKALQILEQLRANVAPAKLLTLKDDIDRHLVELHALAKTNEMMPVDLADAIAGGLHALLAGINDFDEENQSLILGAALYFVSHDDELPDKASILGLDDDAAIFNHVAAVIGREDLAVEL